jgi:hypothetical protein
MFKVLLVVLGFAVEFLVVSLCIPKSLMLWSSEVEWGWTQNLYGAQWTDRIAHLATSAYNKLFVSPGIVDFTYFLVLPTEEEIKHAGPFLAIEESLGLIAFFAQRLEVFWMEIAQDLQRFLQLGIWLTVLSPFWVLFALDGLCDRELKKESFGYQSPLLYYYSFSLIGWMWVILTFLILLPLPMPPHLFPIVLLAQAFLLRAITANVQKEV